MKYTKSRFVYAVLFYILVAALIYVSRPTSLFSDRDHIRRQGLQPGETLFPLSTVCLVAAIASYFVFTIIDMVFE